MFNYDQTLPGLDQLIKPPGETGTRGRSIINSNNIKWQEQGVQTDPPAPLRPLDSSPSSSSRSSAASSANSSSSKSRTSTTSTKLTTSNWPLPATTQPVSEQVRQQKSNNCILLLNSLPPVANNSALVRQRASAKDCLAAASLTAGTSVPLMAGGVGEGGQIKCSSSNLGLEESVGKVVAVAPTGGDLVPKNTALRAEQRKQNNMVSVVRPVVSKASHHHHQEESVCNPMKASRIRLEDSALWNHQFQQQQANEEHQNQSILEDFMMLDGQINSLPSGYPASETELDDQLNYHNGRGAIVVQDQFSEQQARRQAALFRREELELNRSLKKQHRFFVGKLGERKRGLQIVQAVWFQKGFKQAMERLVDIYHQGLIFTTARPNNDGHLYEGPGKGKLFNHNQEQQLQQAKTSCLSSLNTSLVVDVLSVILLRPKLWNLETCQLLLPIINNDLLVQNKTGYESYLEVALKSIKLILAHFSSVIVTTLDQQQKDGATKTLVGVDLSREDRINKCQNCCKLLLEARSVIRMRRNNHQLGACKQSQKFEPIYRELEQLFGAFEASLEPMIRR